YDIPVKGTERPARGRVDPPLEQARGRRENAPRLLRTGNRYGDGWPDFRELAVDPFAGHGRDAERENGENGEAQRREEIKARIGDDPPAERRPESLMRGRQKHAEKRNQQD